MEIRIPSNLLAVLLLTAIFIIQKSHCASLSRQEGKLLIPQQDRATCLEKLICGINVVGTKSAVKDYSNQVDLIRRFFKLYPLIETGNTAGEADDETKFGAETSKEADDDSEELATGNDYNVELEDIVHKPKPKTSPKRTSSKRKNNKNKVSKNKVIFGNTGLPISESISLTGRLIKANRKNPNSQPTPAAAPTPQPQLRTDDETIITQLHQKQILERMARKFAEPRQGRRQSCGEIVCPHTFKQLYESLQASLDSDDEDSPAPALTQYSEDEKSSEEILKVSALSEQNLPSQGAYTISGGGKVSQMTGMEGFFHATDELQNPKNTHTSKYSSKKTKKPKVKKTKKPLRGTTARPKSSKTAQKKAMIANHDLVGTIAPPHKVIQYRPSNTEEDVADNDDSGDDEVDDINKTRPINLVGHPQHDEDLKEIQKKLKQRPSVYHREEDGHDDEQGTSASDENHDDYDEEAKYNVPVDYGNDENDDEEDEDDDVSEEDQIRAKPKRVKKKPKPVVKTVVKTVVNKPINNPSIDYFETSSNIKRGKDKDADDAADSSEEYLDDEDRPLNINSEVYSSIYSRDPMNIGGRPMTPPGDIPVEMTSMGLTHRQRSGGGQIQAQPNLLVRHHSRQPQSKKGKDKKKQVPDSDDEASVEAPSNKKVHSHRYAQAVQQSPVYVHSSDPTEMSTGLSFSRLTAPFQSIFKLVKEGSMFQSGSNAPFKQAQPHYQYNPNPRPVAFNQQAFSSPAQNTHDEPEPELSVAKPAPAPPPPSFNPIVLPRPVGPESSNFKRYKVEKKEKKIPGRDPAF